MSNRSIAVIAEDDTDCNTVRKIVHRVLGTDTKTKLWASKGCSTLKRKLSAKLKVMSNEGCNAFIIVHDLDRNPQNNSLNDEAKLREMLEEAASEVKSINKHICIPIEELEAWFWSDPEVVKHVGRGKGEAKLNPHLIIKPKEQLIKLSAGENRKPRYSTNMNVELAEMLNLELCSNRCPSFKNLLNFLQSL
ncbi:DUF4276 family protein [Scytonema sp. NUACC26]|uniref:DUF4276 family protein n=1 Tax=Scytonema sp. NUACC26 TaxID=3140176 RepID=UPI0034DCBD82